MPRPLDVTASRRVRVPPELAFDRVLPEPLPSIFSHRHGPIPPIREVRDQTGAWDTPGQTRTIVLSDGGRMVEELVSVDRPRSFGYVLSGFRGPLAPLVSRIEGRWSFVAAGADTEVTWAWTLHPRNAVTALALPVFAVFWRGYAAKALAQVEAILAG